METPQQNDGKTGLPQCFTIHWQGYLLFILPVIFLIAMLINDTQPYRCLYVITAIFICWITEVLPLAITAMIPIVAFPLMNIMASDKVCSLYFKETLVMFIISIMIALAMEFTNLHTWVATNICKSFGTNPRRLHLLLVVVTAVLSMIIPNSACIALMYPLTYAVLELLANLEILKMYEDSPKDVPNELKKPSKIASCFYLSVAYASSMGGSANLMGTPSNLVFIELYEERFPGSPDDIDFAHFISYALPPTIVYTGLMYIIMEITHMGLFRPNSPEYMALQLGSEEKMSAKRMVNEKLEAFGSITMGQCTVAALVIAMIVFILTREPEFAQGWGELLAQKEILDASVASVIIFLIFSLPSKFMFLFCWDEWSAAKSSGLLNWKFVNSKLPWDLVFIIGCGGAIAEGCRLSGLARLLGDMLSCLKHLPSPISLLLALIFVVLCTNVTVNAATMSVIAPGILQLAVESKKHPLYFLLPAGQAASMSFLMPASTAPNALVAAFAKIKTMDMIRAGIVPSIASMITIFIFSQSWGLLIYSDLMKFPTWVTENATKPDYGEIA